jgi:hypothetical protein
VGKQLATLREPISDADGTKSTLVMNAPLQMEPLDLPRLQQRYRRFDVVLAMAFRAVFALFRFGAVFVFDVASMSGSAYAS